MYIASDLSRYCISGLILRQHSGILNYNVLYIYIYIYICTIFVHANMIFNNNHLEHILIFNSSKKHHSNITTKLVFRMNVNRENGERENKGRERKHFRVR